MADVSVLFTPVRLGEIEAPNRIFMAPLTRNRSHSDGTPKPWAVEYYRQRASAGLIISEATQISPMGKGYLDTPGIHADAHVEGWRKVTDAVHAAGGRIVLQMWHVGRVSHSSLLPGGQPPVAPSAIAAKTKTFIATGFADTSLPRALATDEIPAIVEDYRLAAKRAKDAGFDGVEVHAANGYLLDQFLRDGANTRDDAYGGPVENRARLLLEAVDAAVTVWGAGRVGVRIGPLAPMFGSEDSDPVTTFGYAAARLQERGLAYIHFAGTAPDENLLALEKKMTAEKRSPIIANGGFDAQRAAEWIANGWSNAVSFGVPFIANPDLVERFRRGARLNPPDQSTFYAGDERGYTDYPTLAA